MEAHHHGARRGIKEAAVCGVSRPIQTLSLMLAMVATMACVLLLEASPFTVTRIVHSPLLKTLPRSELEEQATLYESRPFLKAPALQHGTLEDNQVALDLVDEITVNSSTKVKGAKRNETVLESEDTKLSERETALAALDIRLTANTLSVPSDASSTTVVEEAGAAGAIAQEPDVARENSSSSSFPSSSSGTCDYTVGGWVLDETRPFYSGLECKLWLAAGFSCRLHDHPDPLLDRYRWQPAGCDLPRFNASAALNMLRNKVVAFVGDSLGRQQLQSLLCMLTGGKNDTVVTDVGSDFGFFTPPGDRSPNGYAQRFEATNTTIIFKWTVTLAYVEPLNASDPAGQNALHLDRPEQFLQEYLPELDVVVLNTGHHWNGGKMRQNRYEFYSDGVLVNKSNPLSQVPVAYNATVHNIVHWISKATEATEKVVYYRSLSPRHFRNGDWNTGGTCDTIRFEGGKQVQEGNRVDPNAESAILGTRVNLLNITSLSLERGETHVSKYGGGIGGQDCLHWCLPGIPDTWNEIFLALLATKFYS